MDFRRDTLDIHGLVLAITVLSLAVVIVVLVLQIGWFALENRRQSIDAAEARHADVEALRESQTAALAEYRWVDRERGVISIPVERAMELMVSE